jgi:putative ABC transport system permease protein
VTTDVLKVPLVVDKQAQPISRRAPFFTRVRTMAKVGVAMMFHDKLKLMGTLLGVVFAVVLSNQQIGTFMGLIEKNTMLVNNAGADIWIAPPNTLTLEFGKTINMAAVMQARTTPGVEWAEPYLFSAGTVRIPGGGTGQVTLLGTRTPRCAGGPWNLLSGGCEVLSRPNTMIFEDAERKNLGGLNLGSVRELNGRMMTVGGFTWGLLPFGPSYAFADYDTARELTRTESDQTSFVLVGIKKGADVEQVKRLLAERAPSTLVMTKADFKSAILKYLLSRTALGITFGTSTIFAMIVGFVIVGLSMFSAVVDNVREFGTLKAIGATNLDLGLLLIVQSVIYAIMGSVIGLALVTRMAAGIRSAKLALVLPPWLTGGTLIMMIGLCVFASSLALLRVRKVEPAMVFR